jgi:DNA-binding XRE family transcriptional regulator
LKQSELAELVGCSTVTIQSVEVNRLKLSKSLAARISLQTGADMDWLLANDVNIPMPRDPSLWME